MYLLRNFVVGRHRGKVPAGTKHIVPDEPQEAASSLRMTVFRHPGGAFLGKAQPPSLLKLQCLLYTSSCIASMILTPSFWTSHTVCLINSHRNNIEARIKSFLLVYIVQ